MENLFDTYTEFERHWNELSKYNIQQSKREAFFVWSLIKKLQPKNMIEIGLAQGGSAALWESAAPDSRHFLIDIDFHNVQKPIREGKDILFKDSTDSDTFYTIKTMLKGENVDFLFIDGDHSEPTVRWDYNIYGSLVRQGVIALHNINSGTGVRSIWNEICYENNINDFKDVCKMSVLFPREEKLKDTPQFLGIGIILRGVALSPSPQYRPTIAKRTQ